jgi:hypothetical protein
MGDASMKDAPTGTPFFGPFQEPEAHLIQFKYGVIIEILSISHVTLTHIQASLSDPNLV